MSRATGKKRDKRRENGRNKDLSVRKREKEDAKKGGKDETLQKGQDNQQKDKKEE
jgi:hypothetical protein